MFAGSLINDNFGGESLDFQQETLKLILSRGKIMKRTTLLLWPSLVCLGIFFFLSGCPDTSTEKNNSVDSVTLNASTAGTTVGGTYQLIASISPNNASEKGVTWSSSDNAVSTVDENGLVTGVKEGTATITVTTKDGNKTASCFIKVYPADAKSIDGSQTIKIESYFGNKEFTKDSDTLFSVVYNGSAILDNQASGWGYWLGNSGGDNRWGAPISELDTEVSLTVASNGSVKNLGVEDTKSYQFVLNLANPFEPLLKIVENGAPIAEASPKLVLQSGFGNVDLAGIVDVENPTLGTYTYTAAEVAAGISNNWGFWAGRDGKWAETAKGCEISALDTIYPTENNIGNGSFTQDFLDSLDTAQTLTFTITFEGSGMNALAKTIKVTQP